jgi:hypothetical protein
MVVMRPELGEDAYCDDDITEDWADADSPEQAFLQACYRRLVLSELFYDDDYGLGLTRYALDTGLTVKQIAAEIQRELLRDERVQSVDTRVLNTRLDITVRPHGQPSFPLTLSIDRVSGALLPSENA